MPAQERLRPHQECVPGAARQRPAERGEQKPVTRLKPRPARGGGLLLEADQHLDATDWHTYTAEWTPDQVRFFVDDQLVRTAYQRIDYPLQLMVDLFEFPAGADRDPAAYPKLGEVKAVRGHRDKP